jgi:hypothetical protein
MKFLFFLILLTSTIFADSYSYKKPGVAPVNNSFYLNECGSCHFAYQPGLLPSSSWKKIMNNLENHFKTDASLSEDDLNTLSKYLENNSAEKFMQYKRSSRIVRSIKKNKIPSSISKTPYLIIKHDEIKPSLITQKKVKGIFNCTACHKTANKGIYSERDILIPNFGRWFD